MYIFANKRKTMELFIKYKKTIIGALIGGILGFAYWYFIGCNSGTCPITSSWKISTLYGLFAGLVLTLPKKSNNTCCSPK